MRARRIASALALAAAAGLWGLVFLLEPQREEWRIAAFYTAEEAAPALSPGEAVPGGVYFRNQSRDGCRLRIKICAPELEGLPALEAGHLREGVFLPAGSGERETEYWSAQDGFLYYCNRKTGGILLPGRTTPAAYTAVRLNPSLSAEGIDTLRQLGAEQLYVVAQAQGEEEEEWVNL